MVANNYLFEEKNSSKNQIFIYSNQKSTAKANKNKTTAYGNTIENR